MQRLPATLLEWSLVDTVWEKALNAREAHISKQRAGEPRGILFRSKHRPGQHHPEHCPGIVIPVIDAVAIHCPRATVSRGCVPAEQSKCGMLRIYMVTDANRRLEEQPVAQILACFCVLRVAKNGASGRERPRDLPAAIRANPPAHRLGAILKNTCIKAFQDAEGAISNRRSQRGHLASPVSKRPSGCCWRLGGCRLGAIGGLVVGWQHGGVHQHPGCVKPLNPAAKRGDFGIWWKSGGFRVHRADSSIPGDVFDVRRRSEPAQNVGPNGTPGIGWRIARPNKAAEFCGCQHHAQSVW